MNELLVKSKVTTGVENERTADPSPEAWQAFHDQFRNCFARRVTWAQLFDYWRERCGKEAPAGVPVNRHLEAYDIINESPKCKKFCLPERGRHFSVLRGEEATAKINREMSWPSGEMIETMMKTPVKR